MQYPTELIARAKVRYNADTTLAYIEPLLQQRFGVKQRGDIGQCLITQLAYIISAKTEIRSSDVAKHIWQFVDGGDDSGFTFSELLSVFDGIPIQTRSKLIELKLSLYELRSEVALVEEILLGHPVIVLMDRKACDEIEREAICENHGSVEVTPILPLTGERTHSYLAMGVDADGFVIMRDSRHVYSYNGYLRIRLDLLRTFWSSVRCYSLGVEIVTT
jgi:hypothetical protein